MWKEILFIAAAIAAYVAIARLVMARGGST